MPTYDGSVKFDARIDSSKFKGDLNSIKSTATKAFSAVGIAAGAALIGSAKVGIGFESAFAGVKKTVNATEAELNSLKSGIRDMAKEIPTAANDIAGIAEAAGQLGIQNENILTFTRTMADLGVATNLAGEEAASTLAKLANITQMPQEQFSNLGSTIVALGNNLATTEADIAAMALRLAGAGSQAGLSEAEILSFAGALSSVGIEAEAGGSAFSRVFTDIQLQVETSGDGLKSYAKVAGMTAAEFKTAFQRDAAGAVIEFIKGLNNTERNGKSATQVLAEMGIEEIRLSDALKRAAGASDVFEKSIKLGNQAWEENNALTKEAEQRYATTESKIKILGNQVKDLGITAWDAMSGPFGDAVDKASDKVDELSDAMSDGKLQGAIEGTGKLFGTLVDAAISLTDGALPPLVSTLGFLGENCESLAIAAVSAVGAVKTFSIADTIAASLKKSATVAGEYAEAILATAESGVRGISVSALYTSSMTKQDVIVGVLTGKIRLLTGAKLLATKAQTALNAAWAAHPVGLVVAGVTLLTGALLVLANATKEENEAELARKKALEENKKASDALAESMKTAQETREQSVASVDAEYDHIQSLVAELDALKDASGKVDEAERGRAQFIIDTLNEALGTEISLTEDLAVHYGNAATSVYALIEAKRAEALANAYDGEYTEALKQRTTAQDNLATAQSNAVDAANKLKTAEYELAAAQEEYNRKKAELESSGMSQSAMYRQLQAESQAVMQADKAMRDAAKSYEPYQEAIDKSQAALDRCNGVITTHESALGKLKTGDAQGAITLWEDIGSASRQGAADVDSSIQQLGSAYQKNLLQLDSAINTYLNTGTQEAYNLVVNSAKEVESARTAYEAAGGKIANGLVETMTGTFDISALVEKVNGGAEQVKAKTTEIGTNVDIGAIDGMNALSGEVNGTGIKVGEAATDGVATGAGTHSPSTKTYQTGLYIDEGLKLGILAGKSGVVSAAINVATAALNAINTTLDIHSPAGETEISGEYFDAGFVLGIENGKQGVIDAAAGLGISAVDALEKTIDTSGVLSKLSKTFTEGLKENDKANTEKFDSAVEVLNFKREFDGLSDADYYAEMARLRDAYLSDSTKEWFEATEEIYSFEKEMAEKAAEKAAEDASDALERRHDNGLISEEQYIKELTAYRDTYYKEGTAEYAEMTEEINKLSRDNELDMLEYRKSIGLASEREYYDELEKYRDKYFAEGSKEWYDYTAEIYSYYKSVLDRVQADMESMADEVEGKQDNLFEKFKDYGSLTRTVTVKNWNEDGSDLSWQELKDFSKETEALKQYTDNVSAIRDRLSAGDYGSDFVSGFISQMADMSVEEGSSYAALLMHASDDEFYEYINGYRDYLKEVERNSEEIFSGEMEDAVDEAERYMRKELEKAGFEVPDTFFDIGKDSGKRFAGAFKAELNAMFQELRNSILYLTPAAAVPALYNGNTYTTTYQFYSSRDTTAEQIQTAQAQSERDRLSGGY